MTFSSSLHFVAQAIRRPDAVGAIMPSSQALSRRIIDGIDVQRGEVVLELGPGTGSATRLLERALPHPESYVGIELERSFVRLLRRKFPALRFVHGSAAEATRHLSESGIAHDAIRVVICGLPFGSIGPTLQDRVIDQLDEIMTTGCVFRAFQYVHSFGLPLAKRFRRRMTERFGRGHVSRPILSNVPPALVLAWGR